MLKKGLKKLVCLIIPKRKNFVYAVPHNNTNSDKVDLCNYSSSNLLSFLHYLMDQANGGKIIYLENYHSERAKDIESFIQSKGVDIRLISSPKERSISRKEHIKRYIKTFILQCRCKELWCETGGHFRFKSKRQRCVCFNYFIPMKNDYFVNNRWWSDVDYLLATSRLSAQITSLSTAVSFEKIHTNGFPRCDLLAKRGGSLSRETVDNLFGTKGKRILLYAPTYRADNKKRSLFGYENEEKIYELLREHNVAVIVKKHALDKIDIALDGILSVDFTPNFSYTIYDLMPYTDLMVTDYSSIGYDYMQTGNPVIFNFYDYDHYMNCRGVSYDPIEAFVPTDIAKSDDSFYAVLKKTLESSPDTEVYERIKKMFHKYDDKKSNERLMEDMKSGWKDLTYINKEHE